MLLFRVDAKTLEITTKSDPTAKMNNSSVWLEGKRRDRVTDRYEWFDDMNEALVAQTKAVQKKCNEISCQITDLNHAADQLYRLPTETRKHLQKVIQDYNNDSFFE